MLVYRTTDDIDQEEAEELIDAGHMKLIGAQSQDRVLAFGYIALRTRDGGFDYWHYIPGSYRARTNLQKKEVLKGLLCGFCSLS